MSHLFVIGYIFCSFSMSTSSCPLTPSLKYLRFGMCQETEESQKKSEPKFLLVKRLKVCLKREPCTKEVKKKDAQCCSPDEVKESRNT
jgi:hypothetical protein